MTDGIDSLVELTRALGDPARDYVIIGEGNTSLRLDDSSFAVKASGQQMRNIAADGFARVGIDPILAMLDDPPATLAEQKAIAAAATLDEGGASPSIEVSLHAMLLHECGVKVIGHTHPTVINQILCSRHAWSFAHERRFPDEVVLLGPKALLVPYADPGLPLALLIRQGLRPYMESEGEAPKLILLQNHGMIALGDTPSEILNITAMAVKAARIYMGALSLGNVISLPDHEVDHLYQRPDEIYRRRQFVDKASAD